MIHQLDEYQAKYSQSPILIRHHIPLQFSLKVINSLKMKIHDQTKEDKLLRKLIRDSEPNNYQKHKQESFLFKNKSCSNASPKFNISHKKLSNILKICNRQKPLFHKKNDDYPFTQSFGHFKMAESKLIFTNQQLNLFENYSSLSFPNRNPMKQAKSGKQKKPLQRTQSSSIVKSQKRMTTDDSLRKNGMLYNFKKDLSSSRQIKIRRSSSTMSQRKEQRHKLNVKTSINSSETQNPNRKVLSLIQVLGKKAPSFEMKTFGQIHSKTQIKE